MSEITKTVSPEYRAKCIEWALRTQLPNITSNQIGAACDADAIIEAAKKYYAYVYEDPK